ncbi:MAG: hypothetical protein ACRDK0_04150 [Solirubrobacteraceae bacterium]
MSSPSSTAGSTRRASRPSSGYHALAGHVEAVRRAPAELVVDFGATVDRELLAETVALVAHCCSRRS